MPVRMEVIELMHPRRVRAALAAADRSDKPATDRLVIARIASIDDGIAAAHDENSVDVAVDAGFDFLVERGKRRTGEFLRLRRGHGPGTRRPDRLLTDAGSHQQQR